VAKKGRHRRGTSGRVTPKGPHPAGTRARHLTAVPGSVDDEFDGGPDLFTQVRRALGRRDLLDLLALVSGIVEACTPAPLSEPPVTDLRVLIESFAEVDQHETTALLAAFGAVVDGEIGAIARRAAARRHHPLPPWLATINDITACQPWIMRHVLDDGDDYFVGARWPDGSTVTAIVYVDTNLG
jgi:hypothetical protein